MFTVWRMSQLRIPNRMVRSATWEAMAEANGRPSMRLLETYQTLAANKVGMIITGLMYVNPMGKVAINQVGMHDDSLLPAFKQMVDCVHDQGAVIAAQIAHAGGQTTTEALAGNTPLGPSAGVNLYSKAEVGELSLEQIEEIIEDFGQAAGRAKQAGFDAVQLHMAHAYLISQFFSPLTNQRNDQYGGSLENRARFACQVFSRVRQAVGPDYPVFAKINALDEAVENGLSFADSLQVMQKLDNLGIDALEVSGGMGGGIPTLSPSRKVKSAQDEGYFFQYAREVKKLVKCPVISVGGWHSYGRALEALSEVDAVSMSRPFICQPDLAALWFNGQMAEAKCVTCNKCFLLTPKYGLSCILNRRK